MGIDRHGDPKDRGAADSWYGRPYEPHWWPAGTGKGYRIGAGGMTPAEIEDYKAGWVENEESGGRKAW